MRMIIGVLVMAALSLGTSTGASAMVITSLYGDKDGLGIGVADGAAFDWTTVTADDPADAGTISDRWMSGDQTWSHTYSLAGVGPITGATFEIFTGGQGWHGQSSLYIDGTFLGLLTDGDGFDGGDGANRGRLDTFDLSPYLALLDGAQTISVDTVLDGDGWALDYSELRIEAADAVPEPATLGLVALALAGLGFGARRRGA